MNQETALMNKIRVTASQYGICFRANVGKVRTANGGWFSSGLPTGFSDLCGVTSDGQAFFIEVKTDTGKLRYAQRKFLIRMMELNAIVGVARSEEDARYILENGGMSDSMKEKEGFHG